MRPRCLVDGRRHDPASRSGDHYCDLTDGWVLAGGECAEPVAGVGRLCRRGGVEGDLVGVGGVGVEHGDGPGVGLVRDCFPRGTDEDASVDARLAAEAGAELVAWSGGAGGPGLALDQSVGFAVVGVGV